MEAVKLEVVKVRNEKEDLHKLNDRLKMEMELLQKENGLFKTVNDSLKKDLVDAAGEKEFLKMEKETLEAELLKERECRTLAQAITMKLHLFNLA